MLNALQLNWRWNGMIHKSMSAQVGYVMSHMISYAGKLTNIHMLNMFEASSTCKQATPICFAVSLKWKKNTASDYGLQMLECTPTPSYKSCRTKLSTSLTSPMQSWNHWPWPGSHHAIPAWCDSAFCSSSQYPWDIQRYPNRVSHSLLTKSLYIVDPPVLQTVNSIIFSSWFCRYAHKYTAEYYSIWHFQAKLLGFQANVLRNFYDVLHWGVCCCGSGRLGSFNWFPQVLSSQMMSSKTVGKAELLGSGWCLLSGNSKQLGAKLQDFQYVIIVLLGYQL